MGPADDRPTPSHQAAGPASMPIVRPVTPGPPKKRPDPRPMRLALGAGTLAAVSIMTAGLVRYPAPAADAAGDATTAEVLTDSVTVETVATARPEVRIRHRTVYVQLKPGQKAPRGARVIEGKAPPPRVVVTRIKGKPATRRVQSTPRKVARTRQSGR